MIFNTLETQFVHRLLAGFPPVPKDQLHSDGKPVAFLQGNTPHQITPMLGVHNRIHTILSCRDCAIKLNNLRDHLSFKVHHGSVV